MTSLERLAARLLCVGFDGPAPSPETRDLVGAGVGSVLLFSRNVGTPRQVFELTRALKADAPKPLLVCVDQEGGRVARLRDGFTPLPSLRGIGRTRDATLARDIGRVIGTELRACNIDCDFAPVLDVDTNPANPVIGDRSFSDDPAVVAELGVAMMRGIQSAGVAACGKHFPGHGDTHEDSHTHLPTLPHTLDRLRRVELAPFVAATRAGIAAIMSAHVVFTPIDPKRPATMSRHVIWKLLRQEMNFDGVVFSDDLDMAAVAEQYPLHDILYRGLRAGVDQFLVCHSIERQFEAIEAIVKLVEDRKIGRARIERSVARFDEMTTRFAKPAVSPDALAALNCDEHRRVMARVTND